MRQIASTGIHACERAGHRWALATKLSLQRLANELGDRDAALLRPAPNALEEFLIGLEDHPPHDDIMISPSYARIVPKA